jgi:hypothetical protein
MKHKHRWKFSGVVLGSERNGMAHRRCKCGAEIYEKPTASEIRRHDPRGERLKKEYA